MKYITSTALIAALFFSTDAIAQKKQTRETMSARTIKPKPFNNPLFRKSNLQFQTPEFDKIKDEHFKPAFDYGLKVQEQEFLSIANNPQKPTFENTLEALEKSGELLSRAKSVFYNLTSANTNPTLQALEQEYAPIFSAHTDKMYLNDKLYQRIKAIDTRNLDSESKKLHQYYLENFELAGAGLSASKKQELMKINQELASLSSQFNNKLLDARKNGGLLISDIKELDGLSPEQITALSQVAQKAGHTGKYLISIENTTQQSLLASLKNRNTREKLFKTAWNRASNGGSADTRAVVEKMIALRLQKAQLLGNKSFTEWKLKDQMAKTPAEAMQLMQQIAKPALEAAKKEEAEIQKMIDAEKGGFKVAAWDWDFYAEKVRKEKFDLDESEIKPYFEIFNVLEKGVFYAANKFYGITFKKRTDLPVYHPDVVVYEVFDNDGSSIALYYFDFYARDSKKGGAWMSSFVKQSKFLGQTPVVTNCYNYPKPAEGKPALITFDQVETIFHEFGHAIHGFLSDRKYASLSGTSVPRDFVEFPSQFHEHFALEDDVLQNYALHYQTQKPIPASLVEKIKKASTFNQGYATTEVVSAAITDLMFHNISDKNQIKPILEFEKEVLTSSGFTLQSVPPRYHAPFFAHIWGGGYSSGYYAYLWAETMDTDAWDYFKNNGGFTRENGDKYRKYVLSVGNSVDLNQAYKDLTGREPNAKALLKMRGFEK